MAELQSAPAPQVLSPCSRGQRKQSTSDSFSMSPEFEFWMVRNPPIFPHPKLLSADELFSDGALLPLYRLHRSPHHDPTDPNQKEISLPHETTTGPGSGHGEDSSGLTMVGNKIAAASKSWKDIFKKSDGCSKKSEKGFKGNKKEIKNHDTASNNSSSHRIRSAPELININIWPFSRSRSAGNGGSGPNCRMVTTRQVSSAPCSRSNSIGGEFKSRKWSASPTQVCRGGGGRKATDLVMENAVQTKNNEVAGNSHPPV